MVKVQFATKGGKVYTNEVPVNFIPRAGEEVLLGDKTLLVKDVSYFIKDGEWIANATVVTK